MFCSVKNQIEYTIISGVSGVTPALPREVYKTHIGIGEDAGLFILLVSGDATLKDKYIITNKIGDDIKFNSNIPQYGGLGVFELTPYRPTLIQSNTGSTKYTLYKSGNRHISVGYVAVSAGTSGQRMSLLTDGLRGNDFEHERLRYDINGALLTTPTNQQLVISLHNDVFNYVDSTSAVKYMSKTETSESAIISQAKTAFNAKGYFYSTEDAGNWSGWYRNVSDGIEGEYLPFGGASGSKKIGYLQYKDDLNYTYINGNDIIEESGVWSIVYPENELIYTSTSEPQEGSIVFSNDEATPSQVALTFDKYVSDNRSVYHITTGKLLK